MNWIAYFSGLAVVGLMLVGLYALVRALSSRRSIDATKRRLVTVLESTPLAQNAAIYVAKIGSRYLLIGAGTGGLANLGELPAHDVQAWLEAMCSRTDRSCWRWFR